MNNAEYVWPNNKRHRLTHSKWLSVDNVTTKLQPGSRGEAIRLSKTSTSIFQSYRLLRDKQEFLVLI